MKKKLPKESKPMPQDDPVRHQNVLLEDIRKQVTAVAEGHGNLAREIGKTNERLDGIDNTLQIISSKLSEHGSKLAEHGSKLAEHDKRFDRVESAIIENSKDVQLLKASNKRIEEKLDIVTTGHEQRIQKLETVP